jgi:hypothetical protein
MKRVRFVLISLMFQFLFIVCVLFSSSIQLYAQEIHVRVLNGRNGEPIRNDCVDVFVPGIVSALVIPTDKLGVALLHVEGEHAGPPTVASGKACGGLATSNPTVGSADSIQISSDYYVACQEYRPVIPSEPIAGRPTDRMPSYSIAKILNSGAAAGNTCGELRVKAKPGELIVFVRPLHWWERMKQ